MTNPNIIYVRALDCTKSPHNVRTQSDADADAELEANIGESGIVLQNLIGVAVARKKGFYSIFGGGRRLDRIHSLIAKGIFSEDFMVPVLPVKNARDAIEMSMAENYYSLAMNPADECRGFQAIIEREKKTPADVAKRFGVTERFVLGRLRLAGLAEPVFEALRSGEITLDVAMAYASTSDTERQAKIFEQMATSYHRHNVNEIRRHLASGSYNGGDPKALLVGREAYVAAGGRVDSDLFSNTSTEVWRDGDLVDRLAAEALAAAAEAIRGREGFAEVRTVPATSIPYSETFQLARLVGERVPLAPEAEARKAQIEAEIAEIERQAEEGDGYSEEQSDRVETLEEEIGAIIDTEEVVTDAQKASAIAYVMIGKDGQPCIYEQLYVAASEDPEEQEAEEELDGDEESPAIDEDETDAPAAETYSQKLKDELAMMKTELLALHIANDPHFALDLGTFIMVDDACQLGYYGMPSELRARVPSPRVSGFTSDTPAAQAWAKLDAALDRSWTDHKEMHERYDAFCALEDSARADWLGWAVARTLHAVPDGMTGSSFLNHLGAKLGINVAAWWRPTARNFFDRITKPAILKLFAAIGGNDLKSRYAASRKFDLAASSEKLFAGQIIAEPEVKERALAWLPGPMRFTAEEADATLFDDASVAANDPAPVEREQSQDEDPTALPKAA